MMPHVSYGRRRVSRLALAALLVCAAGAHAAQPQLTFVQLTKTIGCQAAGFLGNTYPSMNAAGTRVAFISSCDLVPGGNTDQNDELYVMNTNGTNLHQLTFTTGGVGAMHVSMGPLGHRIAFASDRDLIPGGNPDGNFEIFTIGVNGGNLTQLTQTTGGGSGNDFPGCTYPHFSPSGHRISFTSNRDLVPGGNSDGNHELFLMNADGSGLQQLTNTVGDLFNHDGSLDGTETRILFSSFGDLVLGQNADENAELFTMHVDGSGLTQLTHTTGGAGHFAPRWTPNRKIVTFRSDLDLTGNNADGSWEVFRMRIDGTGLAQITAAGNNGFSFSAPWDISADGKTIVIESTRDLVPGSNSDLNFEIFLARLQP